MATDTTNDTAIFERIVLPNKPSLSEPAAHSILAMSFGSEDQQRMQELSDKARDGTLTSEEEHEIESYERVGHYLAILQSKARLSLRALAGSDS